MKRKKNKYLLQPVSFISDVVKVFCRLFYKKYNELIIQFELDDIKEARSKSMLQTDHLEKEESFLLEQFYRENTISMPHPEKLISDNFRRGCKCEVSRLDGKIIAFGWWCDQNTSLDGREYIYPILCDLVEFGKDDMYALHFFVSSHARKNNNSLVCLKEMLQILPWEKYNTFYSSVLESHRAARTVYRRVGMKEIMTVEIKRFFFFFYMVTRRLFYKIGENYTELKVRSK